MIQSNSMRMHPHPHRKVTATGVFLYTLWCVFTRDRKKSRSVYSNTFSAHKPYFSTTMNDILAEQKNKNQRNIVLQQPTTFRMRKNKITTTINTYGTARKACMHKTHK